ncbi:hypothetical protein MRB53_042359 [Persea americana]|nr:hypothetical protein MRB53_042359 [Persea americana]
MSVVSRRDRDDDGRGHRKTVRRYQIADDGYDDTEVKVTKREVVRDRSPRREVEDVHVRTTEVITRPEVPMPPVPVVVRQELVIRDRERSRSRERERDRDRDRDRDRSRSRSRGGGREARYEMIERARSDDGRRDDGRRDDRQLSRRDDADEDYYYERTNRQIVRRDEQDYRRRGREVAPRDSASQYYSSDEEVIVKREISSDRRGYGRDSSPHHKLHLAEGAVAGLGAAAIYQRHRRKEGMPRGGAGQLIGGAVMGTVGAELLTRANHYYEDRYDTRSRRSSRSPDTHHNLVKLGTIAALGALAGYAVSKHNKNKAANKEVAEDRRSRSKHRQGSFSSEGSAEEHNRAVASGDDEAPKQPKHKNAVIAGAGLASAAVVGLVERARSKSKGPGEKRGALRTAAPIAIAGLGGAALAGLYENKKAKKMNEEAAAEKEKRRRSKSRPRSESSESREHGHTRGGQAPNHDQNLIMYGAGSPPNDDKYARNPRSRPASYYSDERRGSRSSSSPSPHRRRSDSRAGAGSQAHEASQRRERRRAERERRRQEERGEAPIDPYQFGPYGQAAPTHSPYDQGAPQGNYYPNTTAFPPPPTEQNAYAPAPHYGGNQYSPSEYGPHGGFPPPPAPPVGHHDPYGPGAYPPPSGYGGHDAGYGGHDRDYGNHVSNGSSPPAGRRRQHGPS